VSKKWWLRVGGSVILLGFIAWRTDWQRLGDAFRHLDGRFWLAALALHLATQVLSTWRWQMFARELGLGGTFREYLSYYFVGMFFNLFLPTSVGGDVVRAWYLAHRPGPQTGHRLPAFVSVLADRVSGVVILALVACVATALCPIALPPVITYTVIGVGTAAASGVIGLPILDRLLRHPRFASKRLHHLQRLAAGGMVYYRNPRLLAGTTAISVVVQVNSVIVMALIGMGLGLPVPPLYYGILMPLMTLLTLLPVSVNGVGLREMSTVLLLKQLPTAPVSEAEAVTLAFLLFVAQSAAALVGIIPYLVGGLQHFDAAAAQKESQEDEDEEKPQPTAAA
jgi:glycosyltransferase 2 family protein